MTDKVGGNLFNMLMSTTRRITLVCKMVSVDYLNRTGKLGA